MRHKHADLIIAWANGAEVQARREYGDPWISLDESRITWQRDLQYRIKPEPKPDVVRYYFISDKQFIQCGVRDGCTRDDLKLTFDGETGKLKSAEVIA